MHYRTIARIIVCGVFMMAVIGSARAHATSANVIKAVQAMAQNQWSVAQDMVSRENDPLAVKLYYWTFFMSGQEGPYSTQLAQFIRQNPDWPGIGKLRLMFEKSMPADMSADSVTAWFDDYPPKTGQGMNRYAQALLVQGRKAELKSLLEAWWGKTLLPREDQMRIYEKYGSYLSREAHRKRFDTLLFADSYTNARAIAGLLGPGYAELAEARIALARQSNGVNALISRVPVSLRNDPGLMFERLRWRRKSDMNDGAIEILLNAPPADQLVNADDWWRERHIIARRLIEEKKFKQAYLIVSKHRQKSGFSYAQAEWLAGWLALRFLDQPVQGLQHFEALYHKVETPVSLARGAYWAGRAADAMKAKDLAGGWYERAAKYQTVFYGQMAGAALGHTSALPNATPPVMTAAEGSAMKNNELIRAARYLYEAGLKGEAGDFIQAFVEGRDDPKAYRFAAEYAADLSLLHEAVRITKKATQDGMFLTAESYPLMTAYLENINTEWALVHGIIRQESMFNKQAESPAGALGLMQLMPATAQETARKAGLPYKRNLLTTQESYNINLGSYYLQSLVERYAGSYPLAIAAYNAGPGRVDRWLEQFGDPRMGQVDLIDWMEMIPIYETRNYVQRVMEAVYVYRLRLQNIQRPFDSEIHVAMRTR